MHAPRFYHSLLIPPRELVLATLHAHAKSVIVSHARISHACCSSRCLKPAFDACTAEGAWACAQGQGAYCDSCHVAGAVAGQCGEVGDALTCAPACSSSCMSISHAELEQKA